MKKIQKKYYVEVRTMTYEQAQPMMAWRRSGNVGLSSGSFSTRDIAKNAINKYGSAGTEYRVKLKKAKK